MEPTGFFVIHDGDPGQGHARRVETEASSGQLDEAGGAAGGFLGHLGWMQGKLYLTYLRGAGRVLVNGAPVQPNRPVAIQAGDRISIGNTHLTWNAGIETDEPVQEPVAAEDPKVTVVLPREAVEAAGSSRPEEPEAPPGTSEEPAAADATMFISRDVAEQIRAEAPEDPTLLVPKTVDTPSAPETPEPTLQVPQRPAQPPLPETPEPTLQEPRGPAEPPLPETPEPTLVPKRPAQPPAPEIEEPTLFVQKGPARPAVPQMPDDKTLVPGYAAQVPDGTAEYKTAFVDMAQLAEEDMDLEFESTTILRDTQVPHLVLHTPNRTWEVQLTQEAMTIGRSRQNDIPVLDDSVSQRHAMIERRGDGYVIRDSGSKNGIWLGKQRLEEHRLTSGDVLNLGRAKLVFKGGFTSDELTLIGAPRIDGAPNRRPVVFVPGLMGSELWIGSERLWPSPRTIISNPEVFSLPGDPRIEARGIVNEVVVVPHVIESRQYSAMGDHLVEGLGYTRGKDLLEFGYDWRCDVRLSAQRLAESIERWQAKAPITIIAHSLGTLVTRYYVEKLGGKRFVERIILMGGPHYGTPKGLAAILSGPGLLPFGMADERMRQVLATFPTAYQILPIYPCVSDQNGNYIDVLEDESWLPERQRPFLSAARSFRRELGTTSSVPTVSVFGYGLMTKLRVNIDRGPDGLWEKVEFVEDTAGDQSVPSGSAVLKDSEIHPVLQEHGSLYVDDDVRMRLKVELTRSTTWQGGK